ncbi:hypothetical protein QQ008_07775 [Fulvivirgaceae bacterium BMA10]|uniref:Uncharacterized protein n=1 Tax=Splendidivirga corallicola TaxID=3051826 RepID=A0ABT8KNY1_9BACT|nr:hypothetical protein [Fulvivirgaceae bacterium BMA10]
MKDTNKNENNGSLSRNDQLGCINLIIGAAECLKKSATDDQQFFVDTIIQKAWELRDDIGGAIKETLSELPDGYDYIYINEIVERIVSSTKMEAGSFEWDFENNYEGDFYSRPGIFAYLIQNLLLCSLHFEATKIQLRIDNWDNRGISMQITDNATIEETNVTDNAFSKIIDTIVEALEGIIEKPNNNCVIIRLPNSIQKTH